MTVRPYPLRLTEHVERQERTAQPSLLRHVLRRPIDALAVSILGYPGQKIMNGPFAGQPFTTVQQRQLDWFGDREVNARAAFVDTGAGTAVLACEETTVVHVLWCADERRAHVRAGLDGAAKGEPMADRLIRHPIAPGDSITIAAGTPHALGPGMLAFQARVPVAARGSTPAPGHGLQRFEGFNRHTVCAANDAFALERWKITQPMPMEPSTHRWRFLTNLVEPVALAWPGGSDLIGRGESRLIPAGLGSATLVPDGIAYVLCLYLPDLARDVLEPLRRAGYQDKEIAHVVAMPERDVPT